MKRFFKRLLYIILGLFGYFIFISFLIIQGASSHDVANITTIFCLIWISIQGLFWFSGIKAKSEKENIPIKAESDFQKRTESLSFTHSDLEYIQYFTQLYGSGKSFTSGEELLIIKWKKEGFTEQRISEMLEWNKMN